MTTLRPRPGFDPLRINWGAPDQTRTDRCSYCDVPFGAEDCPLMLWNNDGWCAEFCDACAGKIFGMDAP